jgi:hypothetical protein
MKARLMVALLLLPTFLTACSKNKRDFETAKAAVARELLAPDTAHFCAINEATFSSHNGNRSVALWVDTRNNLGRQVRTHFKVTIDDKTGAVTGASCIECAAEDEKQKLNEAATELQALTAPK